MKNFVVMSMQKYSKEHINIIKQHNENRKNFGKDIQYLLEKKLDENVNFTFKTLEEMEEKRLNYLKKNNRKDYQKVHIVEMVVALSYDKVKQYLDEGKTTKDIDKGFYKYAKNLEDKYGFNVMDMSIHKDEGHIKENGEIQYNYHCHLVCHNFHFSTGKAIVSHMTKQDFRDMQTLAQESFNQMNLDFSRGIDKRNTNAKHLKRNDYILKVKKEELKKVYQELNLEKNNVKEQRKLYEKGSLEYETLNEEYKDLQQKEKEAREEYRNIGDKLEASKVEIKNKDEYEKKIKNEISNIFENHTKLVEPTFGANFYKVENRKIFFNKVLTKVKEPLNAQLNEIEHLKRENTNLNTTLKNSIPKEDYLKVVKAFEIKHKQNLELVKKNKELNEFIKEKGLDIQDIENNTNNDMER